MAYELSAAWTEAAKEITVAILQKDESITSHGIGMTGDQAANQVAERAAAIYRVVFEQVRASSRGTARTQAANVN